MFRDFKEFGFRLETTRIKDPERVCRLLLCVCLAHVWLMKSRMRDERRRVGQQARLAAACGPAQEAATELLPDRLALFTETANVWADAPV